MRNKIDIHALHRHLADADISCIGITERTEDEDMSLVVTVNVNVQFSYGASSPAVDVNWWEGEDMVTRQARTYEEAVRHVKRAMEKANRLWWLVAAEIGERFFAHHNHMQDHTDTTSVFHFNSRVAAGAFAVAARHIPCCEVHVLDARPGNWTVEVRFVTRMVPA